MLVTFLLCTCLSALASDAQRYYERNVVPADHFQPSPKTVDYDYYSEGYGFEEEKDIYKWNVEEYPHPKNTSKFCNRLKPSHVCDPDNVLSKEHADHLDKYIQKLYQDTPCICDSCGKGEGGIVVGIALLRHIYLPYNVHPVRVIRSFAETLRFMWRLGRCENDILIVVVTTDRLSYTDVGKSTSRYLSLHEAHRIFVANKAKFTAGDFYEGLRDILKGYHTATRTMSSSVPKQADTAGIGKIAGIIIGCILLLGIIVFAAVMLYRRCKLDGNGSKDSVENGSDDNIPRSMFSAKDIKVMLGFDKRKSETKPDYLQCHTDEKDSHTPEEQEVINFQLATPADVSFPTPSEQETLLTNVTSESETLEKELDNAAEGIAKTFSTSKNNILMTDI